MKRNLLPLLPALFVLSAQADPRYATFTKSATINLRDGELLEIVSAYNGAAALQPVGQAGVPFLVFPNSFMNPIRNMPAIVAGPMEVQIGVQETTGGNGGFCTVKISEVPINPARTLTLAPTTNAVTIHLEGSTNLVDWTKAASVTLTNVPTATFYRARLE